MQKIIAFLLIGVLGVYGYGKYERSKKQSSDVHQQVKSETSLPAAINAESDSQFKCDGRTYCSQMTSCAEATHFLKNCSGTKMDGNGDGVPCEMQWCK